MLRYLLLLLVLTALPQRVVAQSAATLLERYEALNAANPAGLATCEALESGAFWSVLQTIAAEEARQGKLSGNALIGFAGDEAGDRELYRVNAGVNLSRGKYPAEVDVSSSVGVTFDGKQFRENVSLVGVNFDYHPRLWLENFVFLNRFSDSFLGIGQRYETGGGVIFNHWGGLTEDGMAQRKKLLNVDFHAPSQTELDAALPDDRQDRAAWMTCWAALQENATISEADAERLDKLQQDALNANQKRYFRLRAALLLGIFAELETANITDNLLVQQGDALLVQQLSASPDATQELRWELRPTLDLQPSDNWKLKLRWYFKLPVPGDLHDEIPRTDEAGEVMQNASGDRLLRERFDYRSDLQASLTVTLADELSFQSGSIGVTFSYERRFDNAPPYAVVENRVGEMGRPVLLVAEDTHHLIRFQVNVGF